MQETAAKTSFEIHLDLFEGPLSLLLHLIEKNNMNIMDIPIAQITQEYLKYLDYAKSVETELAGEFLVMAATLMQIKAKMLLPRAPQAQDSDDPRSELAARLLLYQKFMHLAKELEQKAKAMEHYYFRPAPIFERRDYQVVQGMADLLGAFKKIYQDFEESRIESSAIYADAHPVEIKIEKILNLLKEQGQAHLTQVFTGETTRLGMIACFLAILELIKQGEITALQREPFGEIYLARITVH